MFTNYADQPIQIATSSYKWLTQTLFNAQNQFTIRPYITCQIIDETLLVNQQLHNSNVGEGFSGSSVIAPDGAILAIGASLSSELYFTKITDGTQISQWDAVLNGTGTFITGTWQAYNSNFSSGGFHLNASIAVSEYIGGTYTIDIYYWYIDGTSHYQIAQARSTNGGVSFTTTDISIGNDIPVIYSSYPFQLAAGKPVYIPSTGTTSAAVFYLAGNNINNSYTGIQNTIKYIYSASNDFTGINSAFWNESIPNYVSVGDWILHSFDVEYINGTYYIVFSGYHNVISATNPGIPFTATSLQTNFFGNFGLYMTQLRQLADFSNSEGGYAPPASIFTEPREILVFNSSSPINMNQALYPALNYDGEYLWLNYRLDNTTSVSESSVVSTTTNYYLSKSLDFKNFDYPTVVLDVNGNSITSPGVSNINGVCKYSFAGNQNGYYYFWGDGALWQFVQNNVIADISNDIISYQVQDQSGGTSSISLTISNANGQWFGSSPTSTGYQAICKNGMANKNSKVYLRQGYYTTLGYGETVPRNIFYIDDITQNISPTQNDLVVAGRDWNKLLSVTKTAFTFNYQGPDFYNDPFTPASVQNWNQVTGTWIQTAPANNSKSTSFPGNVFVPYTTYTNTESNASVPKYTTALTGGGSNILATLATLSGYSIIHPEVTLSCTFYLPNTQLTNNDVDFYPWYLNSDNFLQVSVRQAGNGGGGTTNTQIYCQQMYNGVPINQDQTNSVQISASGWYTIYIRMSNYGSNVDIFLGPPSSDGNGLSNFTYGSGDSERIPFNWQPDVPYSIYYNSPGQLATIAIGTSGVWGTDSGTGHTPTTIWTAFYNLKFTQSTYSQSVGELTKSLGTIGHVFNYVEENDFVQDLYNSTQWDTSGAVNFLNRTLNLPAQTFALQNNQQYSNGQIEFDAIVNIPIADVGVENYGFDFVFHSQDINDLNNCYKIRIMNSSNNGTGYIVKASILASVQSATITDYALFSSIIPDSLQYVAYAGSNNLNIDLTQSNHYQIAFNNGWIYIFINSIEVLAWYDNNIQQTFTSGYWGFSTVNSGSGTDYAFNANEVVSIRNIKFPTFWQQNNSFALNPGDDLASAIQQNLQTVFGWFFSDLGGRMKLIVLKTADAISYYYGNGATNYLLYNTSNDNSDKEYYNSVAVIGDGVSYIATDGASVGSNGILRSEVIVDYTITTLAGAQSRAQQELLNVEKYGTQPAPVQQINVGSEVFDVVNIQDNSSNNASAIDGNYRVYTEQFQVDNQSNYSITLGTGDIIS